MTSAKEPPVVHEFVAGELRVWLDDSGMICLKTYNRFNDPLEIGEDEALELAELLNKLVGIQRSN
jgi:hypothetical protein